MQMLAHYKGSECEMQMLVHCWVSKGYYLTNYLRFLDTGTRHDRGILSLCSWNSILSSNLQRCIREMYTVYSCRPSSIEVWSIQSSRWQECTFIEPQTKQFSMYFSLSFFPLPFSLLTMGSHVPWVQKCPQQNVWTGLLNLHGVQNKKRWGKWESSAIWFPG